MLIGSISYKLNFILFYIYSSYSVLCMYLIALITYNHKILNNNLNIKKCFTSILTYKSITQSYSQQRRKKYKQTKLS